MACVFYIGINVTIIVLSQLRFFFYIILIYLFN